MITRSKIEKDTGGSELKRAARKRWRILPVLVGIFCVVFVGVTFGFQYYFQTGIFERTGEVKISADLGEAERAILDEIFGEEVKLTTDVTITSADYLEKPELHEGEFLYEILVPVADFYDLETSIAADDPAAVFAGAEAGNYELVSANDLDFSRKLLEINDAYFLDEFAGGAIFRVIKFESEKYAEEIAPLVGTSFVKQFPEASNTLSFAETGVTALSRGMNAKLNEVGDATYFSAAIRDYLRGFDLTHTSNESSFTSAASDRNICSDPRFLDTLLDIGLDIVELTGNHNADCGYDAARETIDLYAANGIKVVGGGKTATEASVPLAINEKGSQISLFAYNLSTGGATDGDYPGANQYEEERAAAEIQTAKARGDLVIVDVQYYECNAYASEEEDATCDRADSAAGDQIGFFRHLVNLGADVVVGTSAHQPQTFELYNDGAIYYGLGNLFFDQIWWPGTTRSLVLEHYIYDGRILQTRITPTVYDENMQTRLMDAETAKWFLGRLIEARP